MSSFITLNLQNECVCVSSLDTTW